jgi:hypothetical protein
MNKFLIQSIFCAFILMILSVSALADGAKIDSITGSQPWKNSLNIGVNLSQNSYSDNWSGGEAGNIAWVILANGTFEKQVSSKFNFRNTSNLQFGQTHQQDKTTKHWAKPLKSTDKIDLDNLGRFTLHAFVDPFIAFRFQSQFLDDSYEPLKRAINPILLTESAGIARMIYQKDKDQVLSRLGFAFRQNLSRAIPGTPADTLAKNTKTVTTNDGGFESVTDAQYKLLSNVTYTGKLTLFKALYNSKKNVYKNTPAADYWKAIDVNWENTFAAAITKIITVNLYTQLLYDKEIALGGRFKETFGLGLTFKML